MRFVNGCQTKEERREKYRRLREAGANTQYAQRARDWTNNHVEKTIEILVVKNERSDNPKVPA